MTPQEVLSTWTQLTGERWRLMPYSVQEQATQFSAAGFTAEEMGKVVAFVKREIAKGTGGFNALSLTWRVMAGDNWAKFQERLSLAEEAERRRPKVKPLVPVAQKLPDGRTQNVLADAPEKPVAKADAAEALFAMARAMKGSAN